MPKAKKKAAKVQPSPVQATYVGTLVAQLDALAGAIADACCLTNYYGGQRKNIWDDLEEFVLKRTRADGYMPRVRFVLEHDTTGSMYDDIEASPGYVEGIPTVGDSFVIDILDDATHKQITCWDGHLKRDLRGRMDDNG